MTQLLPEQTAYAEFTLAEAPDSLPTVSAYKVSADGVFGTQSGMSETAVNVSGLSYYASAIVPVDASPGDRYSLLVTVTVGGTDSVFWLALGQVGRGLTPEQATWLEETHAKAMLIGTGQAFVEVPIDGDSNITVRRSRDYQQADGLAIEWSNPDGTWPDLTGATIVARVARPGCKTSALYDFAASVVTPTGSQIVRLELTKAQLAIIADDYTYELVATLTGGSVVTLVDGQFRVVLGRDAP